MTNRSDDNISEGGSDSSSASQDLNENMKKLLFRNIKKGGDEVNFNVKNINKNNDKN